VSSSCDCSQSVQDTHMACERHRRRIKNVKLSSMLLRFHLWDKTCRSRHHQTLPEHPSLIRFYSTIFFHHFWDLVSLFLKSCHFSSKHIVFSSLHISLVLTNVIFSEYFINQAVCPVFYTTKMICSVSVFQHKYLNILKSRHIYWRSKMTEDIK